MLDDLHSLTERKKLVIQQACLQVLTDVRRKWLDSPSAFTIRVDLIVLFMEGVDNLSASVLLD